MQFDVKNITFAGLRHFSVEDAQKLKAMPIDKDTKVKTSGVRGMFAGREVRAYVEQSKTQDALRAQVHTGMRQAVLARYGSQGAFEHALSWGAKDDKQAGGAVKLVMRLVSNKTIPSAGEGQQADPLNAGLIALQNAMRTLDEYDEAALKAWTNKEEVQQYVISVTNKDRMLRGALLSAMKDPTLLETAQEAGWTTGEGEAMQLKPDIVEKMVARYQDALRSHGTRSTAAVGSAAKEAVQIDDLRLGENWG